MVAHYSQILQIIFSLTDVLLKAIQVTNSLPKTKKQLLMVEPYLYKIQLLLFCRIQTFLVTEQLQILVPWASPIIYVQEIFLSIVATFPRTMLQSNSLPKIPLIHPTVELAELYQSSLLGNFLVKFQSKTQLWTKAMRAE
jgi:hypothetical protein